MLAKIITLSVIWNKIVFPEGFFFFFFLLLLQNLTLEEAWIEQIGEAFQNVIPRPWEGKTLCSENFHPPPQLKCLPWLKCLSQHFYFEHPFLGYPNPASRIHCGLKPGRLNLGEGKWFESNIVLKTTKQIFQIFIIFCFN